MFSLRVQSALIDELYGIPLERLGLSYIKQKFYTNNLEIFIPINLL